MQVIHMDDEDVSLSTLLFMSIKTLSRNVIQKEHKNNEVDNQQPASSHQNDTDIQQINQGCFALLFQPEWI